MEMWELENKSKRKKKSWKVFTENWSQWKKKLVNYVRSIEITQSEKQGEKCLNYLKSHGNLWVMQISLPYVYMECCQGKTKETMGNKMYLKK